MRRLHCVRCAARRKQLTISYQQSGAPRGDCSDAGSALNGGHGDRNGQRKARAPLSRRRGQVDGGPAKGEVEPGVDEGGHDPVSGSFDGGIGQPDNHNVILYSPYGRSIYVSCSIAMYYRSRVSLPPAFSGTSKAPNCSAGLPDGQFSDWIQRPLPMADFRHLAYFMGGF